MGKKKGKDGLEIKKKKSYIAEEKSWNFSIQT